MLVDIEMLDAFVAVCWVNFGLSCGVKVVTGKGFTDTCGTAVITVVADEFVDTCEAPVTPTTREDVLVAGGAATTTVAEDPLPLEFDGFASSLA